MPKAHVVGSEEEKTRPWVVVSSSRFNKGPLGLVVAVPLSRQLKMADITLPGRVRIDNQKITFQDKHLPDNLNWNALTKSRRAITSGPSPRREFSPAPARSSAVSWTTSEPGSPSISIWRSDRRCSLRAPVTAT
jgi:hypothetical protein